MTRRRRAPRWSPASHRKPWTADELRVALDHRLTIFEAAEQLNRTPGAVQNQRSIRQRGAAVRPFGYALFRRVEVERCPQCDREARPVDHTHEPSPLELRLTTTLLAATAAALTRPTEGDQT